MINPGVALDIGGFMFRYPAPLAVFVGGGLRPGIIPKKQLKSGYGYGFFSVNGAPGTPRSLSYFTTSRKLNRLTSEPIITA